MQIFWSIFSVLLVFGLVICFHEFGHYIVAKLCGIGVEIYSFGMGPRAFGWKRGETDYRVSYLPLGGYVKLQGDDEPASDALVGADAKAPAPARDPARDFTAHPKWQRLAVMAAGATFNLILAVILFCAVNYGRQEAAIAEKAPALVVSVVAGKPAAAAGLQSFDIITKIGDVEIHNIREAMLHIAINSKGQYAMQVRRGDQDVKVVITPEAGKTDQGDVVGRIGISLPGAAFAAPPAGSPAEHAGVQRLDLLLGVDGVRPGDNKFKPDSLTDTERKSLPLEIWRDGKILNLTLARAGHEDWGLLVSETHVNDWTAAIHAGLREIKANSTILYQFLRNLFTGHSSVKGLSGPVGIINMIRKSPIGEFTVLFQLAAFISLQLAVVNLLPIPALDGGHILILVLEGIARRDFSRRVKERIIEFGFYGLLALIAVLVVMDVLKFFH
jgi:regulator of sigma E protease